MRAPLVSLALVVLAAGGAVAQWRLTPGGTRSNYGMSEISGAAFEPDPLRVQVTSGGNLAIGAMHLGPGCVGHAMAVPDHILRYSEPGALLRFYVRANGGDATLVVHTPEGRWLCDDDSGLGSDPMIDLESPPAGSYDIWVGSYRADQQLRAALLVSGGRQIP